jgi:outer membrane protein/S-layer protein transport system outer membrane protein
MHSLVYRAKSIAHPRPKNGLEAVDFGSSTMKLAPTFVAPSIVLLAVTSFFSQARAESLSDVVAYAYETNPGLQSQRAALRALDESYVQARSGFGLSASASAGQTAYQFHLSGPTGGTVSANTNSESLSVVQPVWTGGRVNARLSQAEAQIRAAREQVRNYELDLLQRVVSAYLAVRRDLQLLSINRDTVAVLEKQLSDTEAKAAVREVTMTDLAQSKARLAQARTSLASAEQALGTSRAQFLAVVGQNPTDLEPPPTLDDLPITPEAAFEAAEGNNPQLLSAQYSEQGSRAAIAAAKAQRMPSVSARADVQQGPYQPYFATPYSTTVSGSVTVTVPIASGGQISSGIRQATEENNRDRLTIDNVRLETIQNVSIAWEQLAALRKQLTTLDDEVKADEFAFYGVRQEEKFALRSTIEILNAELELTTAQQNLVRARASEYAGRVQLLAVMGVLTPQLLAPHVVLYDPAKNFNRVKNKGAIVPLEAPVRVLDALAAIPIPGPHPAAIPNARPDNTGGGEHMPPQPDPEAPFASILADLSEAPPAPKVGDDAAPASLKVPSTLPSAPVTSPIATGGSGG